MKFVVSFASLAVLLTLAAPAISHAQDDQAGGGGGARRRARMGAAQNGAGQNAAAPNAGCAPAAGVQSSVPGILSVDDTTHSNCITADSLAHIQAYAKSHTPVVIIDHLVKTTKDFGNLKAASVATYKIQEASDKDVTYYGNNAKNGIITITLVPAPGKAPKPGQGAPAGNRPGRMRRQ